MTSMEFENIFIGTKSGLFNSVGMQNIALGYNSFIQIHIGTRNIALGFRTGTQILEVRIILQLGSKALIFNSGGNNNIAIGVNSLILNESGDKNIAIGVESGRFNVSGSGNVFIGNYAGAYETGSNKLYIESTTTTSPLIYGEFDSDILRLNASVHIRDCLTLKPQDSPPTVYEEGTIYFDNSDKKLKIWNGTEWKIIAFEP